MSLDSFVAQVVESKRDRLFAESSKDKNCPETSVTITKEQLGAKQLGASQRYGPDWWKQYISETSAQFQRHLRTEVM